MLKITVFAPTATARVIRAIAEKSGARLNRLKTRLVRPKSVNIIKSLPEQPSSIVTAVSRLFGSLSNRLYQRMPSNSRATRKYI